VREAAINNNNGERKEAKGGKGTEIRNAIRETMKVEKKRAPAKKHPEGRKGETNKRTTPLLRSS